MPILRQKSDAKVPNRRGARTLVKEGFEGIRFVVDVAASQVVQLRIGNHQLKVVAELRAIAVFSILQLRSYRAKIHRVFNDAEVAIESKLVVNMNTLKRYHILWSMIANRVDRMKEKKGVLVGL